MKTNKMHRHPIGRRRHVATRWTGALSLLFVAVAATACGGGVEDVTNVDAGAATDGTESSTDANPSACTVKDDYQDLGTLSGTGFIEVDEVSGKLIAEVFLTLPDDDALSLRLFDGVGPFADGIPTGDTVIPNSLVDCAVCVQLIDDPENIESESLDAKGGVLSIDSIDLTGESPNLAGKMANVSFESFEGNCKSRIGSAAFSLALERDAGE